MINIKLIIQYLSNNHSSFLKHFCVDLYTLTTESWKKKHHCLWIQQRGNRGLNLRTVGPTADLHRVMVFPLVLSEIIPHIHNRGQGSHIYHKSMKTQFPWSLRRKISKAIWLLFLVSSCRPQLLILRCWGVLFVLCCEKCVFPPLFLYPGFNPFSWWFLFLIFHQSSKCSANVAGLLCPWSPGVLYVFAFL